MQKVYIVYYRPEYGDEEVIGCSLNREIALALMQDRSLEIVRNLSASVTHCEPNRIDLECSDGYYYNLTLMEFDLL